MDNSNLDKLLISYPCPVKWDNINPEEKEWLCSQCDKKVVNLSTFSQVETERYLANNVESGESCVRVRIGADGKVISDNCPEFLKPVRNQYRRLEKTVAAGLLLLITWIGSAWDFCVYAADPESGAKGNDPVSKSIKSTTECLKYKLEGIEGYIVDGRPAPSDIREAIQSLMFYDHADSFSREFNSEIDSKRTIDLAKLNLYCNHLKQKEEYFLYFQGKVLQYLIYSKSPNREKPPVSLQELAVIRQQAIQAYLTKAEELLRKQKRKEAESILAQVNSTAIQAYKLAENVVLPKGVRLWEEVPQPIRGSYRGGDYQPPKWVISKSDLLRLIDLNRDLNREFDLADSPAKYSVSGLERLIQYNESRTIIK